MASPVSFFVSKHPHHEKEQINAFSTRMSFDAGNGKIPKNTLIHRATFSLLQESFKHLIQKMGFDDEMIKQILSQDLPSKEALILYLFQILIDDLPRKAWKFNLEALLELKDQEGLDIILTGIKKGKKEFLTYILHHIDKNQFKPPHDHNNRGMLHIAVIYGRDEIVSYLLSQHLDLMNLEDKDTDGLTPFHWALHEGCEHIIENFLNYDLISQKWDLENLQISTLALAVASGHPGTVSLILKHNQFKEVSLIEIASHFGSMLHLAIRANQPKMVAYLLNHEYPMIKNLLEMTDCEGRTPLQLAAFLGDVCTIKQLIRKGADLHKGENRINGTPLHWAVKAKQAEAISQLLSLGADPNRNDQEGYSPLAYLDIRDLETPLGQRCKNILTNFIRFKKIEKAEDVDFQKTPPVNIIFEGNYPACDGFIGVVQALESKNIIKDIQRYCGKGVGSIIATLLAIGYTAGELETLFFKGLEDLFKQNLDLTHSQLQEIQKISLKPLSPFDLPEHVSELCHLTELRNDLEGIIYTKTGIAHLTFGQLKDHVDTSSDLYKHLHIPVYSLLKKQNIFFNTEDTRYSEFVLSDVLAAALSFLGLFKPAAVRRKNPDHHIYEDKTYGQVMSVSYETVLIDHFDDLRYQGTPYYQDKRTNYRTCSLWLDHISILENASNASSTVLSHLITKALDAEGKENSADDISMGRIKKVTLPSQALEEDVTNYTKHVIQQIFLEHNPLLSVETHQKCGAESPQKIQAWKYEIFKNIGRSPKKEILQKAEKKICTLPARAYVFIGRKHKLEEIKASCHNFPRVAIAGLGGIGKSTLTIEYARQQSIYHFIHFIKASRVGCIRLGLIELAGLLHLAQEKSHEDLLINLKIYLQNMDLQGLIIIDGMDDEALFQELDEYFPSESKCQLLISTRLGEKAKVNGFSTLLLEVFEEKEAIEYLTLGHDLKEHQKQAASMLVQEMGCFPLALSHIVRYIQQENISFDEYQKIFKTAQVKLPEKDMLNLPHYEQSIFTTWAVSLEAICKKENGLLAKEMMHFMVLLGRGFISQQWLDEWTRLFHADQSLSRVRGALKLLRDYDFLRKEEGGSFYQIHPLVQDIICFQLSSQNKEELIRQSVESLICVMQHLRRPYEELDWKIREKNKNIYNTHALKLYRTENLQQITGLKKYREFLIYLHWLNFKDYCIGVEPNNYADEAASLTQDDQDRLWMEGEISFLKSLEAEAEIALDYAKKSLCIRQRYLEANDAYIIESHERIVNILSHMGRYPQALLHAQIVADRQERMFGKYHHWTLTAYNALIPILSHLDHIQEALELAESFVEKQRIHPEDEIDWGSIGHLHLITLYEELGKTQEALEIVNHLLDIEQLQNDNHCLIVAQGYASALKIHIKYKKSSDAMEITRKFLKILENSFSTIYPSIFFGYDMIISGLYALGGIQIGLMVAYRMANLSMQLNVSYWLQESKKWVIQLREAHAVIEEKMKMTGEQSEEAPSS